MTLTDGALTAKLPEGEWRILRMGHTSTGHVNALQEAVKDWNVISSVLQLFANSLTTGLPKYLRKRHRKWLVKF